MLRSLESLNDVLYVVFCPRMGSKICLQCFALEQRESNAKYCGNFLTSESKKLVILYFDLSKFILTQTLGHVLGKDKKTRYRIKSVLNSYCLCKNFHF